MSALAKSLIAEEDGLVTPDVGPWSEDKYRLIALYDELFSKGMQDKWDARVYVDLYAGAGVGRLKGTETRLIGSPLIALSVETLSTSTSSAMTIQKKSGRYASALLGLRRPQTLLTSKAAATTGLRISCGRFLALQAPIRC